MSKYVIDGSTLTSIGNAIREKTGGTESIPVTDLATNIASIESGGGVAIPDHWITMPSCVNSASAGNLEGRDLFEINCENYNSLSFDVTFKNSSSSSYIVKLTSKFFKDYTIVRSNNNISGARPEEKSLGTSFSEAVDYKVDVTADFTETINIDVSNLSSIVIKTWLINKNSGTTHYGNVLYSNIMLS